MTDEQINAAIEERDIARVDLEKVVGYNAKLRKKLDEALALVKREKTRVDGNYENYCEILKRIDVVLNERDEARNEVERLRLHPTTVVQQMTTRSEPSRLEIAAMLVAGRFSSTSYVTEVKGTWIKYALEGADALIAATREGK